MFWLCAIQLMITSILTGLIWVIQLVHYPSFKFITKSEFKSFHRFHSQRISIIVVPAMMLELIIAIYLFWQQIDKLQLINLLLVIGIWLSTILLSIPSHTKLSNGFLTREIRKLVITNWVRTGLWTLKLLVSFLLLIVNTQM